MKVEVRELSSSLNVLIGINDILCVIKKTKNNTIIISKTIKNGEYKKYYTKECFSTLKEKLLQTSFFEEIIDSSLDDVLNNQIILLNKKNLDSLDFIKKIVYSQEDTSFLTLLNNCLDRGCFKTAEEFEKNLEYFKSLDIEIVRKNKDLVYFFDKKMFLTVISNLNMSMENIRKKIDNGLLFLVGEDSEYLIKKDLISGIEESLNDKKYLTIYISHKEINKIKIKKEINENKIMKLISSNNMISCQNKNNKKEYINFLNVEYIKQDKGNGVKIYFANSNIMLKLKNDYELIREQLNVF